MIDGTIARRLGQVSSRGAMLDSIADLAFGASILYIVIHNIKFPPWIWICVILIGLIRLIGYGIGFCKYHTFASLHTYMNKITGAFIFAFPLLYSMVGLHIAVILIAFLGFASALEELGITIKSRTLDRDCKGLFI